MFTSDWLKKTQEKYSTNDSDIHIDNYQRMLDYFRATDKNTPALLTANLLKRLLTGASADDIETILGKASRYNDILELFNISDEEARKLKKEAGNPLLSKEEKKALMAKWDIAWGKREAYWASMQIALIPLTQVCFDIEHGKYMWTVDADRII